MYFKLMNNRPELLTGMREPVSYTHLSSACAAREFKLRFMRLGLLVEIIDNPHLMQMQAVLTKPEDLVIGMSISGETEAVLDALRTAGLHHTETVLILSLIHI